MKNFYDSGGFVLVGALLILMLLMLIGIAATTSTVLEVQIAGSDRTHKETFYSADGGTQVGTELIEQSIWDFPSVTLPVTADTPPVPYLGKLFVTTDYKQLYLNPDVDEDGTKTPGDTTDDVSTANRDAYFNYGTADSTGTTVPRTDIQLGSHSVPNAANQMPALTYGNTTGWARLYQIHSTSYGNNKSESHIVTEWRHVK